MKNLKLNRAVYAINPIYDSLGPAVKRVQTQTEHSLGSATNSCMKAPD